MDYRQLAYQTAQKYGIDPDLFVRQIQAESAFRPDAVSPAGAIGLGQLMPATAKELGVDPNDPVQNLEGAARYMKQQLDRFGDPALALAAYNAGPSRVAKANGIPNITETKNYVAKILGGKGGAAMAQEPQKPQGLLGGLLGGQGIGGALGLSPEFSDKLAMAVMAGTGDARLQPLIAQRAASMKDRRALAKTTAQANATADYLERIGQTDLANLLRQGGIDARTALTAGAKGTKETADIQEYRLAQSQGYKGSFADWQQLGKKRTEFGTIPSGYQLVEGTDDKGQLTYSMVPVKGSPDYVDEQKRIEQQKLADQGKIGSTLSFYSAGERIINQIDENPTLIPKTGVLAGLVRDTVFGQTQKNVAEDLAIMEAQMQFETLAQLKAQSPSGASGLGQLTDSERKALGKVKYNFDALQGEEAIKRNIRSAMMFRSYFENGLLDPKTKTYRNATEEELDLMTQGINPFTEEGGPRLIGVGRYLGANPKIQVIGNVTIEEVKD